MEWLTIWLKKIILLVLLAAFLDLILPNTTMQRYVRMVMGLILLMTIISPVFSLFHLPVDELALKLDRYQQQINRPDQTEWKALADKLLSEQDQQVDHYVKQQVQTAVQSQVKQQFGLDVDKVDVKIEQRDGQQPQITAIQLAIGPSDSDSSDEQWIKPIAPIEPVVITVGQTAEKQQEAAETAGIAETDSRYRAVAESLAKQWELTPEQIVITDEQTTAEPIMRNAEPR
ncbi:stage III sporulation protein AF [Brevibacillus fulvus]|uniref:Stage III sporulation protein AF n=1 Tax=Brevibacillus fulvus TaxID=1125967 RepID=A0A938XR10_9BACL|nr:stage III sporulation protein AF [Brevibacillus fulvus]MBM7588578.1 stage III sporulation protein AF [Brevibacillus fulvus]